MPRAKEKNILLIKGAEITRDTPPGHHNALFLRDVEALNTPDLDVAVRQAVLQKAFVFWDHPGCWSERSCTASRCATGWRITRTPTAGRSRRI
jgi:hypothetical protein